MRNPGTKCPCGRGARKNQRYCAKCHANAQKQVRTRQQRHFKTLLKFVKNFAKQGHPEAIKILIQLSYPTRHSMGLSAINQLCPATP